MEAVFNIFNTYGWWGILGLALCGIIYISILYFSKKITKHVSTGLEKVGEKLTDQISTQNTTLMNCIVDQQKELVNYLITKEFNDQKNHNDMVNERMILAQEINNSLKDIMYIHNSQRAFIIELHNSFSNVSGVPFAKYSCTYEWFEKGLLPLTSKITGLPFSQISKIVLDIIHSSTQQKVYTDIKKLEEENPVLFAQVKDERTTAIVYTAMYDKNNVLMGLLVLEYQHPISKKDINLNQLKVEAAELTSILNIRYKYIK